MAGTVRSDSVQTAMTILGGSEKIRLSIQRALLGVVFAQLRAVHVQAGADCWRVRFFVDGAISDDDRESLEVASTELIADAPHDFKLDEKIERCDAPARIDGVDGWACVYARKEPLRPVAVSS